MYTCINRIEQYNDHKQFRSSFNIFKGFNRVQNVGLLQKLDSYGISGRVFALMLSFLDNNLDWFWIGYRHKNIMLILVFLKTPFLIPHFSYYKIMTFLDMLSVIMLSMPIKLSSTLRVIRPLICGKNLSWLYCLYY